jgi:hypothetical protein
MFVALLTACNCGCGSPGFHPAKMRGRPGCTHDSWIRTAPAGRDLAEWLDELTLSAEALADKEDGARW